MFQLTHLKRAPMTQSVCVDKNNQKPRFLLLASTILAFLLAFAVANPVKAQTSEDQLNAVLAVITNYLLEVSGFELELNELRANPQTVTTSADATFSGQAENIEFCFVVAKNTGYQGGDLTITINGSPLSGSNSVTEGENCFVIPTNLQQAENVITFTANNGAVLLSFVGIGSASQSWLGLPSLVRSSWDERAVRKVLKIFAFGGHATDAQIDTWSYMFPQDAIAEMLNFDQHNRKLSPLAPGERYTEPATSHGTMQAFYEYIESPGSDIPIPVDDRESLGLDGWRFDSTYSRMIAMRGLNPFRQRIGFWETNYHLAVNRDAGVSRRQMARFYDNIMQAHEDRLPYHRVMAVAAKSAAPAMQYGHRRNEWVRRWVNGERIYVFQGNQDFAREIHQLYFGIFGVDDPAAHEDVTIPNTALMLTDMRVPYINDFGFALDVTFGTEDHYRDEFIAEYGPLNILGQTITGVDASAKIDNLFEISNLHAESLLNLPIMIISVLADDNLNETRRNQLRAAWAALGTNKDFLTFIHAYATSQMFHSPDQFKYLTSFERAYYLANKFNIDNIEAFFSNDNRVGREIDDVMESDNANEVFRPLHNVFGGQNSLEASDSAVAFEKNYNRTATQEGWQFQNALPVECSECDQGQPWKKDWSKVIPAKDGGYPADYVAEWLWEHVVGNFDNYTTLERAHLLAILGAKRGQNNQGTEEWWELDDRNVFFDINSLLCIRADRIDDGETNNSLSSMMAYDSWRDYCRNGDDGHTNYSPSEIAAFAFSFTGQDIESGNSQPLPFLRGLLDELAVTQVDLNSNNEIMRRRANESVQAALAFIFATPFIFAEGEQ